jgi:DNA-binding MarR family transcriptional regulator
MVNEPPIDDDANNDFLDSTAAENAPLSLNLAKLAAIGSRFFNGLAEHRIFTEGKLDLTEWVALSLIADLGEVSAGTLANVMAISRNRASSLSAEFSSRGLISVTSGTTGSRDVKLLITEMGREELQTINASIEPLLAEPTSAREKMVLASTKNLAILSRLFASKADTASQES